MQSVSGVAYFWKAFLTCTVPSEEAEATECELSTMHRSRRRPPCLEYVARDCAQTVWSIPRSSQTCARPINEAPKSVAERGEVRHGKVEDGREAEGCTAQHSMATQSGGLESKRGNARQVRKAERSTAAAWSAGLKRKSTKAHMHSAREAEQRTAKTERS